LGAGLPGLRKVDEPFRSLEEELGKLELMERPGGPDRYTVRLKARTTPCPCGAKRELYPLKHDGTEQEISGKAYGPWEVDTWSRLDEFTEGRLWQLFESFLLRRFPDAERTFTDDVEPGGNREGNREFLRSLGYRHHSGRAFVKEGGQP
jgi:hypothetical protein